MNILVVGGFEPSGHDAVLVAVTECATGSGMGADSLSWRQLIPGIDNHLIFHLHRLQREGPSLSALMDDPTVADNLASDLWHRLPTLAEYDAVISVHPWSTVIIARALSEQNNTSTVLADCNVNWGPIPDMEVSRVDLFCGGLLRRPVRPALWHRCIPTGVPVRQSFVTGQQETLLGKVCVASGRLGQSTSLVIDAYNRFKSIVQPNQVIVAGAGQGEALWRAVVGSKTELVLIPDIDDVSPYWHGAEWVITKASAASIAEAFAVGAKVVGVASGVLWEDNCMSLLASRGAITPVDLLSATLPSPDVGYWRDLTRAAAQRCIDLVVDVHSGTPFRSLPPSPPLPPVVGSAAELLPETSNWLTKALHRWDSDA